MSNRFFRPAKGGLLTSTINFSSFNKRLAPKHNHLYLTQYEKIKILRGQNG